MHSQCAHAHSFACSRAPRRTDKPAAIQTADPWSCEQKKTENLAEKLWCGSVSWAECVGHKLSIQRTSHCPQPAAGWRLYSAQTPTPSKPCRLPCKNRTASFSSRGKDTTEEFPEKGILVEVNESDIFSLEFRRRCFFSQISGASCEIYYICTSIHPANLMGIRTAKVVVQPSSTKVAKPFPLYSPVFTHL